MFHYICCFEEDIKTHKELRWRIFNWPLFFWVSICIFGIFSALIVGGIYGINANNAMLATYSFVMSTAFVIPCIQMGCHVLKFFKGKKKCSKINVKFLENNIVVNDDIEISYYDIKRIIKTKNYIVLILQDENRGRMFLPIKKNACNCNWETLIDFVNDKRKRDKELKPTR